MNKRSLVLYLHVHQPYRLRENYTIFDIGHSHNYFEAEKGTRTDNEQVLRKVAEKSYLPMNQRLRHLLDAHPEFRVSFSITGTVMEQLERFAPDVLASFQDLVRSGRVDIVAETYYHSLAFFFNKTEFEAQVKMHHDKIRDLFGVTPKVFRNTEFAYNNDLAYWADKNGYKGILAEGWDPVLGWRSPNYVYKPAYTDNIRLLMKNYRLSDDLAFRFGDQSWSEWPLTAEKYVHWIETTDPHLQIVNLFMDYETFGEHQWAESGIFDFLDKLPQEWLKHPENGFMTVTEAATSLEPSDSVDVPNTITWADTERDLSAWLGNSMQQSAIHALYDLANKILSTGDMGLISDWRKLQTSDHVYYMCTKWFHDGDIHAYFSPYDTPYKAFIVFMNAFHDLQFRLSEKGIAV